jgi:hypothetical protein
MGVHVVPSELISHRYVYDAGKLLHTPTLIAVAKPTAGVVKNDGTVVLTGAISWIAPEYATADPAPFVAVTAHRRYWFASSEIGE